MSSQSTLIATAAALSVLGFSACKTVYSDTFSYRRNNFQAPVAKQVEVKAPPIDPKLLEGAPGGGLPGEMPGGLPGIPGAPAPGVPGVPDGAAPAPGVPPPPPAVPGT